MKIKLDKSIFVTGLVLVIGFVAIILSLYLPWFTFSGIAEHAQGTVQVSGEVSAFGFGGLYGGGSKVTMWSSKHWDSGSSDFWFGYLIVIGLILVLVSTLFLLIAKRPKFSMLLTLIGCAFLL